MGGLKIRLYQGWFQVIINIMLLDGGHIAEWAKEKKRRVEVSRGQPLVLVVSEDFMFLGEFAESVLLHHKFSIVVKHFKGKQLMGHTLPILIFQDVILTREGLVEFLCDAALSHLTLDQYLIRKQCVKDIYQAWSGIFQQQEQSYQKGDLPIVIKDHLSNTIYEEFLNFSKNIVNKGYERVFTSYNDRDCNIEALLMMDITDTILRNFQREKCDYVLRADFSQQIDYVNNFKARPELAEREIERKYILLDGSEPGAQEYATTKLNLKWFSGVLVGLAFIFGKWAH